MGQAQDFWSGRNAQPIEPPEELKWPGSLTRIPDWIYTDPRIYELEQQRIFQGRTWNYVALECQLPKPGDYIRSHVGAIPVVVARDAAGEIHVVENRCAHRGAEFCKAYSGNAKEFICPYHQWTYDLSGRLVGVPFRRGLRKEGGMPASFRMEEFSLRRLHVTRRGGVVFASFRPDVEPLEDYLGPEILTDFDATFDGRELRLFGQYRNTLPGNWKLYHENLKDPYHATLLHSYLVTFGLFVAGNKSAMIVDRSGRHGSLASAKEEGGSPVGQDEKKEMLAFHDGMKLNDPRIIDYVREFNSPWSANMLTIWPNLIVQRELNTLGVRQLVPNGPNEFLMVWTMFGYADDSEEMIRHRLRQGNLMGPSGFLGFEDHEVIKFVQDGLRSSVPREGVALLEGDKEGTTNTIISEAAIRSMYRHYRETMGL